MYKKFSIFCRPIPRRRPVHVVVGRPIAVERNLKPTAEEVLYIHIYADQVHN